ncbi:hypothetical protein U9M48_007875 [Paspalum notatum var. saurae]|uniref:Uncharacterized protein n=1 Tax=Paspalum notatum var. saurae TaxID=547442 RepID=A0AAQ3SMZ5_PASNO
MVLRSLIVKMKALPRPVPGAVALAPSPPPQAQIQAQVIHGGPMLLQKLEILPDIVVSCHAWSLCLHAKSERKEDQSQRDLHRAEEGKPERWSMDPGGASVPAVEASQHRRIGCWRDERWREDERGRQRSWAKSWTE